MAEDKTGPDQKTDDLEVPEKTAEDVTGGGVRLGGKPSKLKPQK